MANHSWLSGDWNHPNAYFRNSIMSPESSEMRHHSGSTMYWSSEEQAILEDGLARYSSEPSISRYAKIALELQNKKTIRDVATRCRWMHTKENNKRRKEDHNMSGRAKVDNKEIVDMVVASNSATHMFASSHLLREEDVNRKLDSLLQEQRQHQETSHKMKHMPPWPEKLRDDHDQLLDSILPPSHQQ
uniref:Myb-like domain-containing protein n=1 Tax=Brassica campestris TaxID=3711 RepID=M4C7X8_BRACM